MTPELLHVRLQQLCGRIPGATHILSSLIQVSRHDRKHSPNPLHLYNPVLETVPINKLYSFLILLHISVHEHISLQCALFSLILRRSTIYMSSLMDTGISGSYILEGVLNELRSNLGQSLHGLFTFIVDSDNCLMLHVRVGHLSYVNLHLSDQLLILHFCE